MGDAVKRLQSALADRYAIQRELGRGGMATVYLAEDRKHHRQVALKVLRPELAAALGPERFLREIEIAAPLNHPHILPLLDSGDAEGLLYYVMPYVAGESLRDRLTRETQLPIEDALQIAREVADGLAYAHRHGVVHRDIKPENILLSDGHAVIADFGIAHALSAAGGERLTETGIVVGTPAYMSPEQGSGAREIDGRSDVYSLGCVVYEMLAGEPPFAGATAQAIIAKRLAEQAPRVSIIRDTVPAGMEAALTRALARTPADRYATASQFATALENAPNQPAPAQRGRRAGWRVGTAGLLVIVSVAAVWWFVETGRPGTLFGRGVIDPGDRVLLADFANLTDDTTLAYAVREGVRTLLADPRIVRLVDPAKVRETLVQMGRPPDTRLEEPVAREVAERENAKVFLAGEVSRLGAGYQLTTRVVQTADGVELLRERVTAQNLDGVIDAVDRLGGKLRRSIGESMQRALARPPLARVTTASLAALRAYSEARRLWGDGPTEASRQRILTLLDQAIARDSDFAMAYRFQSVVLGNINHERFAGARLASERAYRLRERLPEVERLMVTGTYRVLRRDPAAEATFQETLALDSANPWALINLSDLRLTQRRWAAESLAVRAINAYTEVAAPCVYAAYYNALEAQVAQQRFVAAAATLDRMQRQGCGGWSQAKGYYLFARREYDGILGLAASLSNRAGFDSAGFYDEFVRFALVAEGRLHDAFRAPASNITAAFDRARLYVRYAGDRARAIKEIAEARKRFGWDTIPPARRPYGAVISAVAEAGRVVEARHLLDECLAAAAADSSLALDLPAYRPAIEGAVALAEGRFQKAADDYLRWNAAPFTSAEHPYNQGFYEAGAALDRLGKTDSAMTLYERALSQPVTENTDVLWYPPALRRLGELHESLGHRSQAIDYYTRFIDLWKDADPELQPQVAAARQRLKRLTGELVAKP